MIRNLMITNTLGLLSHWTTAQIFSNYTLKCVHLNWIYRCLKARDAGGSMVIHTFGGYYGLSISWMLYRPNLDQSSTLQGSVYHSDVFAMIGEPALTTTWSPPPWTFSHCDLPGSPLRYPLLVDVLAQLQLCHHRPRRRPAQSGHQHLPGPGLDRADHRGHLKPLPEAREAGHGTQPWGCFQFKLLREGWWRCSLPDLPQVHIQNSTLAGGVAVGTAAEFMLMPYGSLIVGFCCGIISTLGYIYLTVQPFRSKRRFL